MFFRPSQYLAKKFNAAIATAVRLGELPGRACLAVDFPMDDEDWKAGKRVTCPLLPMKGVNRAVTHAMFDIDEACAPYATNLLPSVKLPSAHYPMEAAPEETYTALHDFFRKQ